jgi:hypothetical protein
MSGQFESIMEGLQDVLEFAKGNDAKNRVVSIDLKRKATNKPNITPNKLLSRSF